jgi:hypothetical protein
MVIEVDADLFAFRPDPRRARMLDAAVRADFAASIGNVLRAVAEQGAIRPDAIGPIVAAVRDPGASPGLITAYAGLVEAIYGDRADEMAACLAALEAAATTPRPAAVRLVTLDDGVLGPGQAERYRGLFDATRSPCIAPLPARRGVPSWHDRARPARHGVPNSWRIARSCEIVFMRNAAAAPEETSRSASVPRWGASSSTSTSSGSGGLRQIAGARDGTPAGGLSRGTPVESPTAPCVAAALDPRPLGHVHAT